MVRRKPICSACFDKNKFQSSQGHSETTTTNNAETHSPTLETLCLLCFILQSSCHFEVTLKKIIEKKEKKKTDFRFFSFACFS
jgi:hypothetical protein